MSEVSKYQRGKIYKIVCNKTNLVYIGSTVEKYLSNRLKGHCRAYREYLNGVVNYSTTSFKILENGDYYIELIELFPCNSKDELLVRERYYFDTIECVNKCRPMVESREETDKQYRENNRELLNEKSKKFYIDNKEKIQEIKKKKYEDNKEKINEIKKVKFVCACGSECRISDTARHEKSKKHLKFINN